MIINKIKSLFKGIIGKCSDGERKERFHIYLTRDSVCAADDCLAPHSKNLRVKSIDDLAHKLQKKYLPHIRADVYWIAHLCDRQGAVLFKLDIPKDKPAKLYVLSDDFHLEDEMSIYMEYIYKGRS